MRFAAQREGDGVRVKAGCPDCRLTAWQQMDPEGLGPGQVPSPDELTPYATALRDMLTSRLKDAGCEHPLGDDAVARLVTELREALARPLVPAEPA